MSAARAGRRTRGALLALLAAGVAALVGYVLLSHETGQQEESLDGYVERVLDAGAPGVLVLVRDDDETRRVAAGVADREPRRLVRPADRFRIGSVTKTFVATVVLQLAAERRIRLADTVEEWLPGLVPDGRHITLRQLLQHTSGLYDYVEDPRVFAPYVQDPAHEWTPRQLVRIALSHPRTGAPDHGFAYSSTNYLLLGLVVEAATGTSLERQLEARILDPLGLHRTSFDTRLVRGPYLHGHRPPAHGGIVTGPPRDTSREAASWSWAAGAIVSTASDVTRFFSALLGGRLLRPSELQRMRDLRPAGTLRYGLGLAAFPTPCGEAWGHTGNAQGTVTVAWNRADASRQVVLVVNTYPLSAELEAAVRELQDAAFCVGG